MPARQIVEPALGVAGPAIAHQEAAREIGIEAHGADHVGIEGEQLARAHGPVRGFLKPGIGARARRQQPRLGILPAALQRARYQDRKCLLLGHSRYHSNDVHSVLPYRNIRPELTNGYVFVTDGACMTSVGNQNPSLTFMAITARAANFAVEALKKKNL